MSNAACGIQLIDSASTTVMAVDALLVIIAMIWVYLEYSDRIPIQKEIRRQQSLPIHWSSYIPFILITLLYAVVLLFDGLAMNTITDKTTRQSFSYVGLIAAVALLGYIFYIIITTTAKSINWTGSVVGMITAMVATASIIFHIQIIVAADD